MRITGGEFCGRRLRVPRGRIMRPTQDRVREALFSMVAERMSGARFADLFAGSGAVGLEAFSCGAGSVCCVECDKRIFRGLESNVRELNAEENVSIHCADVVDFIKRGVSSGFDMVYADPPYGNRRENVKDFGREWCAELLNLILERDFVVKRGLFVMEQSADNGFPSVQGWREVRDRTYGDTRIGLFVRE